MTKHKNHTHHHSTEEEMSSGAKCVYAGLMFLTQILLFGVTALSIYWVINHRGGFSWEDKKLQFNWHPVLMIVGFIFSMGQSMLIYGNCRCCKKTYAKLLHTLLHLLVMPAVAVGTVAIFEYHRRNNYAHFYSLHSWIGLGTLGMFVLQFIVGFFTYLVFLCCDKSTANLRARMMPTHVHFGLVTFVMAVMTCITGITEFAFLKLKADYWGLKEEAFIVNAMGVALVLLTILITYIIRNERFRRVRVISMS